MLQFLRLEVLVVGARVEAVPAVVGPDPFNKSINARPPTHLFEDNLRRRVAFSRARALVEVGQLRRARAALDGAVFGMVEDADATPAALQRLHPSPGTPNPDCDLLSPPGVPSPHLSRLP
jgi:hypothetical protein